MSKKLICLISTHGKTPEEVAVVAWGAHERYQEDPKNFKPVIQLENDKELAEYEITFVPTYKKPKKKRGWN